MLRFAVVYFIISTCSWSTEIYHHKLLGYPNSGYCNSEASLLAERFQKKTGVEIYWAGVLKESKSHCDIRLSYIANTPVELESSVDTGMSASIHLGTHASHKDCEASLAKEIEVFEKATGLQAWVSYCYFKDSFLDPYPFVSFIEGIGKGKLKIFGADTIVPVSPNRGWNDVKNQMENHLGLLQVIPASMIFRPYISAGNKELSVRFYGKERLWLSSTRYSRHSNPKICESQIDAVRQGLITADLPPISVYCGQYSHNEYWLNLLGLSTNIFGAAKIEGVLDPKTFTNLGACTAEVPSILKFYKEKLGKKTLAAICGDGTGSFQATIFIENK